jgi:hypothetical protein
MRHTQKIKYEFRDRTDEGRPMEKPVTRREMRAK